MILLPSLGRERTTWLEKRITEAHLAALSVANAPQGTVALSTRDELLRLSGTESIRLMQNGKTARHHDQKDQKDQKSVLVMPARSLPRPGGAVDLDDETLFSSVASAVTAILGQAPRELLVTATSPFQKNVTVQITVRGDILADHLRRYAAHVAALSLAIALITGLIVYLALDRLLVMPIRRLTVSISRFRADPEHAAPTEMAESARVDDEIGIAARELAQMQIDLRAALWRNARLAALGTAVAKISHDLRNILSSALLIADRFGNSGDPATRKAAGALVAAVEQATDLVTKTLNFAREGPPPMLRSVCNLADLVDDVAAQMGAAGTGPRIVNEIDRTLAPRLDRTQIFRVLFNLMRNAAEAGATEITLRAVEEDGAVTVDLIDNGPGLPEQARANLFRPFAGSGRRGGTGLGLAIARDLVRAHGGDLDLIESSPSGTTFRMLLPGELA